MQGLAEGNSTLAARTAEEAKEAKSKAELRAEQAEAQVRPPAYRTRPSALLCCVGTTTPPAEYLMHGDCRSSLTLLTCDLDTLLVLEL